MREKSTWIQILVVSMSFALILMAVIRILVREPPPVVSVARETTHLDQLDQDTYETFPSPSSTTNYVVPPRPKPIPVAMQTDVKPLPLPGKVEEPNMPIDPNKHIAKDWQEIESNLGFSMRLLVDGTTEVRSSDGRICTVGQDETFTILRGEPYILKSGVPYFHGDYKLCKFGIEIPIDQEIALWLRDEYRRLAEAAENAHNEESRAKYLSQRRALIKEFGTVICVESTIVVDSGPSMN